MWKLSQYLCESCNSSCIVAVLALLHVSALLCPYEILLCHDVKLDLSFNTILLIQSVLQCCIVHCMCMGYVLLGHLFEINYWCFTYLGVRRRGSSTTHSTLHYLNFSKFAIFKGCLISKPLRQNLIFIEASVHFRISVIITIKLQET